MKMKIYLKGQAAILLIFVIGMVGLLIGMSLSKTGFAESMMGRGTAGSTYAFYVANSGIEDAFSKIQEADEEEVDYIAPYTITVGEGEANVTITGTNQRREILSVGKYENYVRKLNVVAFNTEFNPGFHRAIQADVGGVELENTTHVDGDVYSNSFVKGVNRGMHPNCQATSTTRIDGNVWAVNEITYMDEGQRSGPCIMGNAYTSHLDKCRVSGSGLAYFDTEDDCYYVDKCNSSMDADNCSSAPEVEQLPTVDLALIEEYMDYNADHFPNCTIDGNYDLNDCWTEIAGVPTIGNVYIDGNLTASVRRFNVSGTVFVDGDITIKNNQDIYPTSEENSFIMVATGKIIVENNVHFISSGDEFLLLASSYRNNNDPTCQNENDVAINISNNVSSILFYAINDCVIVGTGAAGGGFTGSVIGHGVKILENTSIIFDANLVNARFTLSEDQGWQISSFTEL